MNDPIEADLSLTRLFLGLSGGALALVMSQMTSLEALPSNLRIGLAVGMIGMLVSLVLNLSAMFRLLRAQHSKKRELARLGVWLMALGVFFFVGGLTYPSVEVILWLLGS